MAFQSGRAAVRRCTTACQPPNVILTGLDIASTAQRLTMRADVYEALAARVGDALDYEIRWQPDEFEPAGFVERVRPLELSHGILVAASCPQCGAQLIANRAEVACACGQAVSLG